MTPPSARTTVAVMLIIALTVLCVGDLVQAALPNDAAMGCASRVCDGQSGCGMAAAKPAALQPAALVDSSTAGAVPTATTPAPRAAEPRVACDRQVLPLAPRSPPVL